MKNLDLYEKERANIENFDRLEWHSKSLLGKMIRLKTRDWSNHTGITIRFHEYDSAGIFTVESLENGVDPNRLSVRLKEFDGEVRLYRLKPEFHHLRKQLGEASLSFEGIKYDFLSIVKNLFHKVSLNSNTMFCSEFVKSAGVRGGLPYKDLYAPTPGKDMDNLGWWEKEYITIL